MRGIASAFNTLRTKAAGNFAFTAFHQVDHLGTNEYSNYDENANGKVIHNTWIT